MSKLRNLLAYRSKSGESASGPTARTLAVGEEGSTSGGPLSIEDMPAVEVPLDEPIPDSVVKLAVRYPECLQREFSSEYPAVEQGCARSMAILAGQDLSFLATHSPGLRGNDWNNYLLCSMARMARSLRVLQKRCSAPAKVLDFGSYLGNFSFMLREAGYDVHALDAYRRYGDCLSPVVAKLQELNATVLDFDAMGPDCAGLASNTYDAVFCMGVIEHIPHTPRLLLETLNRVLKPGGWLIMDTPNLGYLYKREQLRRGESVYCPLELQYETALPFEGHHREFTVKEVRWMIDRLAHEQVHVETFLYSIYGLKALYGNDLDYFRQMQADPEKREIILTASQKPRTRAAVG